MVVFSDHKSELKQKLMPSLKYALAQITVVKNRVGGSLTWGLHSFLASPQRVICPWQMCWEYHPVCSHVHPLMYMNTGHIPQLIHAVQLRRWILLLSLLFRWLNWWRGEGDLYLYQDTELGGEVLCPHFSPSLPKSAGYLWEGGEERFLVAHGLGLAPPGVK